MTMNEVATMTIRVLCVDDHPLVRKGIASILANEATMTLVGEADNGRDAVDQYRRFVPDVVLMDLRMRGMPSARDAGTRTGETPFPWETVSAGEPGATIFRGFGWSALGGRDNRTLSFRLAR